MAASTGRSSPSYATLASTKSTILMGGGAQGSLTITVASISGISKGSTLTIGTGATSELALVESISGTTVTLSAPLNRSHSSGEKVSQGTQVEYRDAELPQDACANGRVMAFGKQSAPVVAGGSTAFASGLSPQGRLVASAGHGTSSSERRSSPGSPHSVRTATRSSGRRSRIRGRPAGSLTTQSTSALLPLKAGRWFYRVRGVNALLARFRQGDVVVDSAEADARTARIPRRPPRTSEDDRVGAR